MTVRLHISQTLDLPIDWMLLATVVYGARGSGKTTLGCVLAEEVHAREQRFCAIDLKGDWWGLKATADGAGEGIPVVVFGGDHADLPLEPEQGALVAEIVAGIDQSCVLDLERMPKSRQLHFLAAFFQALYDKNRAPLLLLLDEVQRYAPQKPASSEAKLSCDAVEDLVKLGRKHGLGVVLLTQRGAGLSKEVSELCDALVAFRTPGPLDQERVRGWLEANVKKHQRDAALGELSELETGTAIFASGHPLLKIFQIAKVRPRETFDSSATPTIGARVKAPKKLATPDLEALKGWMAEAIERRKENDPVELKKRIKELQDQLGELSNAAETEPRVIEVPVIAPADLERLVVIQRSLLEKLEGARGLCEMLTKHIANVGSLIDAASKMSPGGRNGAGHPITVPAPWAKAIASAPKTSLTVPAGGKRAGDERILDALAALRVLGVTQVSRQNLAAFSRQSYKSSDYMKHVAALEAAGEVVYPSKGHVAVTDAGLRRARPPLARPSLDDLHTGWRQMLGAYEVSLLDVMLRAFPKTLSREELAEAAGKSAASSDFMKALAKLCKLGAFHYPGKGVVGVTDLLFPTGLR